jgi:transcriptional antiterminator
MSQKNKQGFIVYKIFIHFLPKGVDKQHDFVYHIDSNKRQQKKVKGKSQMEKQNEKESRMDYIEILEAALAEKSKSRKQFAKDLGVSPAAVTNVLTKSARKGINLNTFLNMLDVLEFEVVVQKKTRGRRREGQMILTLNTNKEE